LDGLPVAIKDNLLVEGTQSAASSQALKGFVSPIDATTVKRLREAGSIVIGKANMDEFGMGSYGQYGYEGNMIRNPIN
jgi:aspartyl-tRNA(Asn)/glutamyl-tRNA(Gln) amidotransferase subunit A